MPGPFEPTDQFDSHSPAMTPNNFTSFLWFESIPMSCHIRRPYALSSGQLRTDKVRKDMVSDVSVSWVRDIWIRDGGLSLKSEKKKNKVDRDAQGDNSHK
jgi:hypothetical protein